MLGDGVLKGLMHLAQAVLQDFAEADQDRQRDAAQLEIVDQFFQIDARVRFLVGMDQQVAVLADRKIAFAPTGDVVELRGVGGGPSIGGLPYLGGRSDLGVQREGYSLRRDRATRNVVTGSLPKPQLKHGKLFFANKVLYFAP